MYMSKILIITCSYDKTIDYIIEKNKYRANFLDLMLTCLQIMELQYLTPTGKYRIEIIQLIVIQL